MGLGLRSSITISCLLYLGGCTASRGRWQAAVENPAPASTTDATIVSDATTYLRTRLNEGACDLIYSDASEEFRLHTSSEDWRGACEHTRSSVGQWGNSNIGLPRVWGRFAVVDATAPFSGRPGRLLIIWLLENSKAKLYAIRLESGERYVQVPAPTLPYRLIDPPPPTDPRWMPLNGVPGMRS